MPSTKQTSNLTDHLGYWLRAVSNHVSHAFARKLADRDTTVAEWVMMRSLYGKDATAPSRLAESMGMTRGAITKLADRLIGKSLVVREASPNDARAQTLALTARGRNLVPNLAQLADRNDEEFFEHLTQAERRELERVLRRLVERLAIKSMPIE